MRIREVQGAADEVTGRLIWRIAALLGAVFVAVFIFFMWKRRHAS